MMPFDFKDIVRPFISTFVRYRRKRSILHLEIHGDGKAATDSPSVTLYLRSREIFLCIDDSIYSFLEYYSSRCAGRGVCGNFLTAAVVRRGRCHIKERHSPRSCGVFGDVAHNSNL